MTSLRGTARRCHRARVAAILASSLDFLQGTFEKIHFQSLLGQQPLKLFVLPPLEGRAGAWSRRLLSRLNDFKLPAPLVEVPPRHPQLPGKRFHIVAGAHPFNRHPL
jgi:hypothetical protein